MMKDKLEEYVKDNRAAFDIYKAPDKLWQSLSEELGKSGVRKKKVRPIYYFIGGVAATLLLCTIALTGYYYGSKNNPYGQNSELVQAFQDDEEHYRQVVNRQMDDLQTDMLDPTVIDDLHELDAIYEELKAELQGNQGRNLEQVILAMQQNYKSKIQILNTILEKQKKENKKRKDEYLNI